MARVRLDRCAKEMADRRKLFHVNKPHPLIAELLRVILGRVRVRGVAKELTRDNREQHQRMAVIHKKS
jgi:hypothetical protein